ncbi:MAG: hypothetical protein F6K32_04570 [Desertifilum sp. SIO1I2]|nr:hypothetical protein [Desertifilum sp. SIO1I2]
MIVILIIVIALVAWSLHLMQEAVEQREFSLMLAGFLVAVSAAAMVAVYFLMGHYVGYMSQMNHESSVSVDFSESMSWVVLSEEPRASWEPSSQISTLMRY